MADSDYYNAEGSNDSDTLSEERDDNLQETALIPKSVLGDKEIEVGKKCEFKIVSVHDDEVEIEYVPHKKKDKDDKKDSDDNEAHASIERGIARMGMM